MGILKTRVAGAWVDTAMVGGARVAGAWVPFAPPPSSGQRVQPAWNPGLAGNAGLYAFGFEVQASAAVEWLACWFYAPAGQDASNVTPFVWNVAGVQQGTGPQVAAGSIVVGAWNRIPLATPVPQGAGSTFVVTCNADAGHAYTPDHLAAPIVNGPLTVTQGRYESGGGFPDSTWTSQHGVDGEWVAA